MQASLLSKAINRSNLTLLLVCAAGLLIVALAFVLNLRYLYNFLAGPFDAAPADLAAVTDPGKPLKYWLRVSGEKIVDTGVQYVSTSNSGTESVDASYYALLINRRLLIVKLNGSADTKNLSPNLTGWLEKITPEEDREIIQSLISEQPGLQDAFYPYKLNSGDFRISGILGGLAAAVISLLSLWGLFTLARRAWQPERHPVLKSLALTGPLDLVTPQIESELARPHTSLGNLHLTDSWLVYAQGTRFQAARLTDLTWLYKHVLTTRSYGIAVNRMYSAMVYDRFGRQLSLTAGRKEKSADDMLQVIYARAPWMITGFSKDMETSWKKDRPGFLAAVERRKAEIASKTSPAA